MKSHADHLFRCCASIIALFSFSGCEGAPQSLEEACRSDISIRVLDQTAAKAYMLTIEEGHPADRIVFYISEPIFPCNLLRTEGSFRDDCEDNKVYRVKRLFFVALPVEGETEGSNFKTGDPFLSFSEHFYINRFVYSKMESCYDTHFDLFHEELRKALG